MMKVIRITNSWHETGPDGESHVVLQGGQFYPVTQATMRQVELGNGEVVDAPEDAEKAAAAAEAAQVAADKAAAKAEAAMAAADAAAAAGS